MKPDIKTNRSSKDLSKNVIIKTPSKANFSNSKEECDEVYNLPDNVFQKSKKPKHEIIIIKPEKIEPVKKEEPIKKVQQQQIVDDDFIEKAFENEEITTPLKSPLKSPVKSPMKITNTDKSPVKITNPDKSTLIKPQEILTKSEDNPFLNNYVETSKEEPPTQESSHHVGSKSMSQSPLKSPNIEIFQVNDNAKSEENYCEKENEPSNSEDHEVYDQDEESEDLFERNEESKDLAYDENEEISEENCIQAGEEQEGLHDILEASNENSDGEKMEFGEDGVKEEEEKNEGNQNNANDLQEKYEDAVRREKELKNIIEVKVRECEKALGKKIYEEIISFFREKLNVSIKILFSFVYYMNKSLIGIWMRMIKMKLTCWWMRNYRIFQSQRYFSF